jgi:hypothetical protein
MRVLRYLTFAFLLVALAAFAENAANKRLILKDGSYQIVTKYQVVGDRVRYISTERGGDWEELPNSLVDWPATEKWAKEHVPGVMPTSPAAGEAAAIDKEEQQERAEQDARMPQIGPGLRLPDDDSVWGLDTFHGLAELIELAQNSGNVSENTTHNVLRSALNPLAGTKQLIQLEGAKSKVQFHVAEPEIYVSLSTGEPEVVDDSAHMVETHGAGSEKCKNCFSSPTSRYAIVRVQAKKAIRVIGAVNVSMLGNVSNSEDMVETTAVVMPGKHWMKLTPKQPLAIGEYALMEILGPKEVNLSVWDFGVNPQAPEAKNARTPIQGSW